LGRLGTLDRQEHAEEVYVRHLQREIRLPGLTTAADLRAAAAVLIEGDWLRQPPIRPGKRSRMAYPVNPRVLEAAHESVG
jgi:hypothetical protein